MRKACGKSWWKIPAFCIVAGLIWYEIEVRFLGRFAIVTLPDGSIASDNALWMIVSAILFVITLAVGGLLIFRRMTRKELMLSAFIMFAFGLICGLIAHFSNIGFISIFYSKIYTWCDIISQALYLLNVNQWVSAVMLWAAPFLFVLFGKKDVSEGNRG